MIQPAHPGGSGRGSRIRRVPGSHQIQWLDVLHRHHAVVEDHVRTNRAMGLHNLPAKSWTINEAWMLSANLAADLDAWLRLSPFTITPT